MDYQLKKLKQALNQYVFKGRVLSEDRKEKIRSKTYRKKRRVVMPALVSMVAIGLFVITALNLWNTNSDLEMGLQTKFQSIFNLETKDTPKLYEKETQEHTPPINNHEEEVNSSTDRVTAVRVINEQQGWVGGYGWIARTNDQGYSWEIQYTGDSNKKVKQIFALNGQYAWAVLTENEPIDPPADLIRTVDGGENWEKVGTIEPSPYHFQDSFVHFNTPEIGFVGHHYTEDGGKSWTELNIPDVTVGDVYFRNRNFGWAAVYENLEVKIKRTTDGGKTWETVMTRETVSELRDAVIRAVGRGNAWVMMIGEGGMNQVSYSLFRTSDGGASWRSVIANHTAGAGPAPGFDINSKEGHTNKGSAPGEMYVISSETTYVAGECMPCDQPNSIGWTQDGGSTWRQSEQQFPGNQGVHLAMVDEQTGWIVTEDSKQPSQLWITSDGGQTWESVFQFNQLTP